MKSYEPLAQTAVDAIEQIAGVHPGFRRAHAKGRCYHARFTPTGEAAAYTTAPHLQREEVEALVRFSDSSPLPKMPDGLSPVKGMSVLFQLPGGDTTALVAVTVPVFLTKTPEAFVDMIRIVASKPGPRDIVRMMRRYPEARAAWKIIRHVKPFTHYSTSYYYPIHTFYFVNEKGIEQPVKYEWAPQHTRSVKAAAESMKHPADYVKEEINSQLPVLFDLMITLGEKNDPITDPTVQWPRDRETFCAGTLTILSESVGGEDSLFDPTDIPRGIKCSEDPVLLSRSPIYKESYRRRTQRM